MWWSTGHLLSCRPLSSPKGNPVRGLASTAQRILGKCVLCGLSTYLPLEVRSSKSKNYEAPLTKVNTHKALEAVQLKGPRSPLKPEGQSSPSVDTGRRKFNSRICRVLTLSLGLPGAPSERLPFSTPPSALSTVEKNDNRATWVVWGSQGPTLALRAVPAV